MAEVGAAATTGGAGARHRPWLAVSVALLGGVVLGWASALAAAVWFAVDDGERAALAALLLPRSGVVMLFVLLLPLLLAALLRPVVAAWPRAAARLREEVGIVAAAHAAHRVTAPRGAAPELRELAAALDGLARAHAALRSEVEQRIGQAQARLAEETQRLAALMSELPQAVVVCNRDGRVLLYNARAAELLDGAAAGGQRSAAFGLGRALAGVLDGATLEHARQQLQRRLDGAEAPAVARFVTTRVASTPGRRGVLLRGQMVPVRGGNEHDMAGYVLMLDDVTRAVVDQGRRDTVLQRLTEGSRAALANLRAATQALQHYPAMDEARRRRFTTVVHDEAERLALQLEEALRAPGQGQALAWPREDLRLADLALALQHSLRSTAGIDCHFDGGAGERWLEVDSPALVQLLTELASRIAAAFDLGDITLQVQETARLVRLDLCWQGPALAPAQLLAWESLALGSGSTVREVLDRHGAEWWTLCGDGAHMQRLCLQLPAAAEGGAAPLPAAAGRPVSYDFDLFHQAGQSAALDDTALAALSYTVFDCETTGLRPAEGDEIIAIGAVRIVNQRLLEHECFDRLCRPRRAVRASAQAVHGIGMAQLQDQPPLEQVLPAFAQFCEGTVLVAHNAAFDMRFLALARERCGVRFDQPVLDTLLLSGVVHRAHGSDEHHLEQIAARLGVPVSARHQALGDALLAARVFIRLLPLLAEHGIVTLGQAREASQRTPYAREGF